MFMNIHAAQYVTVEKLMELTWVKKAAMRRYCSEASNSILTWSFSTLMHVALLRRTCLCIHNAGSKCRRCSLVIVDVVCLGGIRVGDAAAGPGEGCRGQAKKKSEVKHGCNRTTQMLIALQCMA
jgi:hypothetical protein